MIRNPLTHDDALATMKSSGVVAGPLARSTLEHGGIVGTMCAVLTAVSLHSLGLALSSAESEEPPCSDLAEVAGPS